MRNIFLLLLILSCGSSIASDISKIDFKPFMPHGYVEYCDRVKIAVECGTSNKYTINERNMTLATLRGVNRTVNSSVRWRSDKDLYNKDEYWSPALDAGDCEDYVLKKMHILIEEYGWSPETLHITSAWDSGVLHVVLVAELHDKLYVLDNVAFDVYELTEEKHYVWSGTQLFGNSNKWIPAKVMIETFYPSRNFISVKR